MKANWRHGHHTLASSHVAIAAASPPLSHHSPHRFRSLLTAVLLPFLLSQTMGDQAGATLQNYNGELVACIEEVRVHAHRVSPLSPRRC